MSDRVELNAHSERTVRKLPPDVQDRLLPALRRLAEDPFHDGVVRLARDRDMLRVRVGDYRIMYRVDTDELLVTVVEIARRDQAYRPR